MATLGGGLKESQVGLEIKCSGADDEELGEPRKEMQCGEPFCEAQLCEVSMEHGDEERAAFDVLLKLISFAFIPDSSFSAPRCPRLRGRQCYFQLRGNLTTWGRIAFNPSQNSPPVLHTDVAKRDIRSIR